MNGFTEFRNKEMHMYGLEITEIRRHVRHTKKDYSNQQLSIR